jgi:hypothetical protein
MTPQLQLGINTKLCEEEATAVAVTVATPSELSEPPVGSAVGADSTRASNNHVRRVLTLS